MGELTWYEERQRRKHLHPLLRFHRINDFVGYNEYGLSVEEMYGFHSGGYQRKGLTDTELSSLSEWLYDVGVGNVTNSYGLIFKNPEDAVYYKLKWGTGGSRIEKDE